MKNDQFGDSNVASLFTDQQLLCGDAGDAQKGTVDFS